MIISVLNIIGMIIYADDVIIKNELHECVRPI